MDIGLYRVRKVEIHHHAEARHINAAGGHVGGDQNLKLAALEFAKHLQSDRLAHVAMQHVGVQPLLAQPVGCLLYTSDLPTTSKV